MTADFQHILYTDINKTISDYVLEHKDLMYAQTRPQKKKYPKGSKYKINAKRQLYGGKKYVPSNPTFLTVKSHFWTLVSTWIRLRNSCIKTFTINTDIEFQSRRQNALEISPVQNSETGAQTDRRRTTGDQKSSRELSAKVS